MNLGQKRRKFSRMISLLTHWLDVTGQSYFYEDGKCRTGHMKNSLHYIGLAQDFSFFSKTGKYLTTTRAHLKAGEFWESMGGTWGGRFGDGNHYSLAYRGRK